MKSGGDCIVIMRLKIFRGSIPLIITWYKTTSVPILALRGMSCQVPLPARAGPRQVLIEFALEKQERVAQAFDRKR